MKPKDKKEDVQYINNLLDYLDKPELIQHKDGTQVRAIHHFPDNQDYSQVVVVFKNGAADSYHSNGQFCNNDLPSNFILKPKEKKIAKGWTRKIVFDGGKIVSPNAVKTKDEFMELYQDTWIEGYGPWEEVVVEVCDD